jgi:hypothetical protein
MLHAWSKNAAPEMQAKLMRALEKSAGLEAGSVKDLFRDEVFTSRDGKQINGHEALAEYWEDYLAKKHENIPPEIKSFFDRLVEAIRGALKHLGKEIPPEIEAIFNDIVSGKKEAPAVETRAANNESQTDKNYSYTNVMMTLIFLLLQNFLPKKRRNNT